MIDFVGCPPKGGTGRLCQAVDMLPKSVPNICKNQESPEVLLCSEVVFQSIALAGYRQFGGLLSDSRLPQSDVRREDVIDMQRAVVMRGGLT